MFVFLSMQDIIGFICVGNILDAVLEIHVSLQKLYLVAVDVL